MRLVARVLVTGKRALITSNKRGHPGDSRHELNIMHADYIRAAQNRCRDTSRRAFPSRINGQIEGPANERLA
jgi:hypothetical protein